MAELGSVWLVFNSQIVDVVFVFGMVCTFEEIILNFWGAGCTMLYLQYAAVLLISDKN